MENLNKNILERIKRLGVSKKKVADEINIDPSYFYRMIDGKQRWQLEYLEKIASVLGTPLWRLFYEGPESEDVFEEPPDYFLSAAGRGPRAYMEGLENRTVDAGFVHLLP